MAMDVTSEDQVDTAMAEQVVAYGDWTGAGNCCNWMSFPTSSVV